MTVQHDKILDIALGNSRKTKTWKNRPIRWSEMLDRLSKTIRTAETVAEYSAMSREQQSERKDQGGFVGGYCNNGSRSDIRHRSILCLDADFADADLWPDWELIYGNAAAVYSTHKHTNAKPRLRLVIPLSRNVDGDEYQAIGRRVASVLGIDKFDDTSYQPQRMMYWPSTSQDGEFFFRSIDAPFLDADAVLATYHDWRDVSSWPMSSRVADIVKKSATKQKDPLEKGGLVGAFCRAYTIQEAIEAYIPTYLPCDEPSRYTYVEGSTGAGVVIYDDKFSYSHHATDPASGQLCNAWDLVRLHRFHDMDTDPEKPPTQQPSYKAMTQLAMADERVKLQLINDRTAADFEALLEPTNPDAWKTQLQITEKGGIASTIDNIMLILQNDPKLAGCLAHNEMEHNIEARRSLPWREVKGTSIWDDMDDSALRHYMEKVYGISGKEKIFDAVNNTALISSYHPVKEYLNGCTWDGVKRVDTLLIDYLGAEDNAYVRAVTRKTIVAAVARIFRPGVKFDYMLTLRGRQGIGKSALIAKLGGKWFSDTFTTMHGKEAYEQVMGVWIMEIGELAGMRKAEAETIKLFISKTTDRFRPAYGRRSKEFPRQCIFIGTTNEEQFLRDATGNRRFWVVDTPNDPKRSMWDDLTPEVVSQIWAEAVALHKEGEKLYLPPKLEKMAREVQACYEEENPRAGIIAEYLDRLLPVGWETMDIYARRQWLESDAEGTVQRNYVCSMEIWAEALGGNPEKIDRYIGKEIRDIVAKVPGWRNRGASQKVFKPYGKQRFYERITEQ